MTRRATYALMLIVVVLAASWLLSTARERDTEAEQRALTSAAEGDAAPGVLPVADVVPPTAHAEPVELAVDASIATHASAEVPPDNLLVHVTHADGTAARGAGIELYAAGLEFLARGRLDTLGSWHDSAHDGAGVVLVLGATGTVERFDLSVLAGRHDLELPEGEVVSGRVLVNGEPPGERVPLSVRVEGTPWIAWKGFGEPPGNSWMPGHWPPQSDRGLLTELDGSFRVSGLATGAEVSFGLPRALQALDDSSTPMPVRAPSGEVWLHAWRRPVLHGRLLGLDGQPARSVDLRVGLSYRRATDLDLAQRASTGGSNSWSWQPAADDGRFEISLGIFPSDWAPLLEISDAPQHEGGVVRQDVEFSARDAEGNWLEREFEDIDTRVDHDLGDLTLQPAQRWRLRVVDTNGTPIPTAKLRPTAEGPSGRVLKADDDGRIDLDLGAGGITTAMLVADAFEARLLELPATAPEEIEQIVLAPSTRVALRLHGAWDDPALLEGWDFVFTARGAEAAFHDALLARAYDERSAGPDEMRTSPDGANGSGWGSSDDGTIWAHQYMERPTLLLDGLRAHHPLTLLVAVRKAPDGFDNASTDYIWQQDVWLEPGQLREIDVDLSEWFPRR